MRLEFIKSAILTIICFLGARPAVAEMLANNEDEMKRVDGARLMEKIGFKLTPLDNESAHRWGRICCATIIVEGESYIAIARERNPYVYELRKLMTSEYVGSIHARQFSSAKEAALAEFSSYRFDSSMFPDPIPSSVILEYKSNGSVWISLKSAAWCDLLLGSSLIGFHTWAKDIGFNKKVVSRFLEVLEKDYDETNDGRSVAIEQIVSCIRLKNIGRINSVGLLNVLKEEALAYQEELWKRNASTEEQWKSFVLWLRLSHKHNDRYGSEYIIDDIEAENIYIRLIEWKKLGRYTDADIEKIRKVLEPELGVKIELKE